MPGLHVHLLGWMLVNLDQTCFSRKAMYVWDLPRIGFGSLRELWNLAHLTSYKNVLATASYGQTNLRPSAIAVHIKLDNLQAHKSNRVRFTRVWIMEYCRADEYSRKTWNKASAWSSLHPNLQKKCRLLWSLHSLFSEAGIESEQHICECWAVSGGMRDLAGWSISQSCSTLRTRNKCQKWYKLLELPNDRGATYGGLSIVQWIKTMASAWYPMETYCLQTTAAPVK